MTPDDIVRLRLRNQQLVAHDCATPGEVVAWLGAVQAQDYAGAKWALGLRMPDAVDADIEHAMTSGQILRTHVMRPTWHFVTPGDIRWMLELTAPRVKATMAYYHRQLELDEATFKKSARVLAKALHRGRHLTRAELAAALEKAAIDATGQRGAHLLMHAELDALICSGARRGKQVTYALLEERVPPAPALSRDEALVELARRYFTSHGPAMPHDFAWWSGLTISDARRALDALGPALTHETIEGKPYWFRDANPTRKARAAVAHLLPNYDEYGIAYKDRSAFLPPAQTPTPPRERSFPHFFAIDGIVRGTWRREEQKRHVIVSLAAFEQLTNTDVGALEAATERYSRFRGLPVTLMR